MLADLLLAGLLLFGVLGLVGLVWRKLPVLLLTDPGQAAGAHEQEVKRKLVESRLKRKLSLAWLWFTTKLTPVLERMGDYRWGERLQNLEGRARERLRLHLAPTRTLEDYLVEGDEHLAEGELAAAEQAYLEVLRLDPHHLSAYQGLGDVYLEGRDYEQAREVYEYLAQRGSAQVSALGLARVASGQGKLEEARGKYLTSLSFSTAIQPRLELAKILRELGKVSEALEQVFEARSLEPNNPKILDFYIELSILNGQPERAQEALNVLRQVNADNQKISEFVRAIRALEARLKPKARSARRNNATNFGVNVRGGK